MLNGQFSKTIIDQLVQLGVDYFCLSPGNRSAPLALALATNSQANSFIHFDERGSAFHALGYAKATKKPACVIVTSGTALGNLMPAVMEAKYSHVPLLLLTADRPAELRDTSANQTADQIKIFGDFVEYFFDLPSPSATLPDRFLATTLSQAISRAKTGPVQINCPFPEPFCDGGKKLEVTPTLYTHGKRQLAETDLQTLALTCAEAKRGVIVAGNFDGEGKAIVDLANTLGWPLLADITSPTRKDGLPFAHHILEAMPEIHADLVLHVGGPFVSKVLMQWTATQGELIHIDSHLERCDPLHAVKKRIVADPEETAASLISKLTPQAGWNSEWKDYSLQVEKALLPHLFLFSEPGVIKALEKEEGALFFGNSMPIRDADMFLQPKGRVFANRGLSGIDGNIATIAGIASQMPVTAVIGDQTFLHDLNSLAQISKCPHTVKLIVVNNGGGGIFSFFNFPESQEVVDTFFAAKHDRHFANAAALFDIPYELATDLSSLQQKKEETCIIEVKTSRIDNVAYHKALRKEVIAALCSSFSTVS